MQKYIWDCTFNYGISLRDVAMAGFIGTVTLAT